MPRRRDVERYAPRREMRHASLEDFESADLSSGIHSISAGEATVDLLLDDDVQSGSLVVFLPSAVSSSVSWPYFQGLSLATVTGQPLLSFSDPTIERSTGITTAWTLGDDRYWLHHEMDRYIDAVRRGRRLIFVGSSAGGFPALYYGSRYPDSVSVVVNPRTHLFTPPTHLQLTPSRLYGADGTVERIRELVPLAPGSPRNTVVYLQNSADHVYFSSHMVPYLQQVESDARVWTHLGDWGEGHKPAPPAFLHEVVRTLATADTLDEGIRRLPLELYTGLDAVRAEQMEQNVRHFSAG